MKIVVTGAEGFLGFHLNCHLLVKKEHVVVSVGRSDFSNTEKLTQALMDCDVVVHLAGVNRGEEDEVYRQNIQIMKQLISVLEDVHSKAHVIFSSSTHIFRETSYGKVKRDAARLLQNWSEQSGGRFTELVLPHIFGEGGRPFYNSAVATFCHQLARSEPCQIVKDVELELMHASEVVALVVQVMELQNTGQVQGHGRKILVSDVLQKLQALSQSYRELIIPAFQDKFELHLFNTLRFALFPDFYPVKLNLKSDLRGNLFEFVKSDHGGQGFVSTTLPDVTRGNHFHYHKVERFCVVKGQATIRLRRLFDSRVYEFAVSGEEPCYIDMPSLYTHNITNTGECELITLFWSHEIFDMNHPDTFAEAVFRE